MNCDNILRTKPGQKKLAGVFECWESIARKTLQIDLGSESEHGKAITKIGSFLFLELKNGMVVEQERCFLYSTKKIDEETRRIRRNA